MKTILKDLINNKVLLYSTGNLKPIMENNMKKNLYVYKKYIYHFALHQKLIQYCKLPIIQLKKIQ